MQDRRRLHRVEMKRVMRRFTAGEDDVIFGREAEHLAQLVIFLGADFREIDARANQMTPLDRHAVLDDEAPHQLGRTDDVQIAIVHRRPQPADCPLVRKLAECVNDFCAEEQGNAERV